MIDISSIDYAPFWISFKLAGLTSLILFALSLPLAWWLSQTKSKSKPIIEAITALPIVLPPSVLGFYILVVLSPHSAVGSFFEELFGVKLVFSFAGLVVASCFYSLPFMVQPLQSGFEALNKHMLEACSRDRWKNVSIPHFFLLKHPHGRFPEQPTTVRLFKGYQLYRSPTWK